MKKVRSIHSLDLDRLQEVLDYDPETGVLSWRIRLSPNCKLGVPAGCVKANGYRYISIDKRAYFAHQLAWFHFYGEPPNGDIDHENTKKDENWIANLREATPSQNKMNTGMLASNTLGFKGIVRLSSPWKLRKPYAALIRADGKRIFIGTFATVEEAGAAYAEKAKELHGRFARVA